MGAILPDRSKGKGQLVAPSATIWGYIRHELLYLGFALMEIALLTPIVLVILGWARYWPPYQVGLWLLLIMLVPFNLIRLMSLLRISLKRQRRLLLLALVITVLQSWRLLLYNNGPFWDLGWMRAFLSSLGEGGNLLWTRDLSIFIVTTFVWWRGIRLAIRHPELGNVGLRLRLGGLILLPLILWFSNTLIGTGVNVEASVLLFFFFALTVISLVRAENVEQEQSGTASTLNAHWFMTVVAAALLIIILTGTMTALLAGESLFVAVTWLSPLWSALQFGATVTGVILFELVYPSLELFAGLIQWLSGILGSLFGQVSATLLESPFFSDLNSPLIPTPTETVETVGPTLTGKATAAFIMIGLLVIIALALAKTYRQATFATRDSERSRAIVEPDDEPDFGRRLLKRIGLLRNWRAAASVRRIYRQMCAAAAAVGYPRSGSETPYEYLSSLNRVWPELTDDTRLITEAFIRVRYGEVPETDEELETLRSAWRRLDAQEPIRREATGEQGPVLARRD